MYTTTYLPGKKSSNLKTPPSNGDYEKREKVNLYYSKKKLLILTMNSSNQCVIFLTSAGPVTKT